MGDFPWRVNDRFTYGFGDYLLYQLRVEKVFPLTALATHPVCVSGRQACPRRESVGPDVMTCGR